MLAPIKSANSADTAVIINKALNPNAETFPPTQFITVKPKAGATAVEIAIDKPNIPNPSPIRLQGIISVTQVEAELLDAAWKAPCTVRNETANAIPAATKYPIERSDIPIKPMTKSVQRPFVSTSQPRNGRETIEAIEKSAVANPIATLSPPKYSI